MITERHDFDTDGNPAGGETNACGVMIDWQRGPRAEVDGVLAAPNGAFVEDVIRAAIGRLEFFNGTQFRCRENSLAITKLEEALHWMDHRTADRRARGVEGSHTV